MDTILTKSVSVLGAALLLGVNVISAAREESKAPDDARLTWRQSIDRPMIAKQGQSEKVVIKIEIEGGKVPSGDRMPLNLAVVLDRSGSMSGAKLEQAKQAAMLLVDQLDEEDVFSLVVYETEVEVVFPAARLGNRKSEIKRCIRQIETGGSTALYGGVESGGRQLQEFLSKNRINRVMLLSDGIANVGPSSNREIATLGTTLARKGMSVTTIGLGDDYNETLMTALAEASDANYYYVADVEKLPDVFRKELGELKAIVARDIEIRIECPEGVRPLRFLGRPEELKSKKESIRFATLSSEQTRELYLECEIEKEAVGKISEIAIVSISSDTDADKGSAPVVVGYTEDVKIAESTVNRDVMAEAIVWRNAMETERSVALADQGNIAASRANFASQKAALQSALAAAPAAQKEELADQIQSVEEAEAGLGSDGLSKQARKKLTNETYQFRNSKK
ncbi:MAG: VWA domain-containing protein [Verrucomicrobiales bacterium]|nr:VWA domain-containing protein [Verrucomicrobiales bacterium]